MRVQKAGAVAKRGSRVKERMEEYGVAGEERKEFRPP